MQLYMITILHKVLSIVRIALKFSEETIEQAIEWVRHLSPSIAEAFEKKYLEVIMKIESTNPISLKIFADQFLRKIPTSEAAVERVFSRHKPIHTAVRARLSPDVVCEVLFIRYNASRVYTTRLYSPKKTAMLQTCLILI